LSNKTEGNNASSSSKSQQGKKEGSNDKKGKDNGNMEGSNSSGDRDIKKNHMNSRKGTEESSDSSTVKLQTKITKRVGDIFEEGDDEVIETGFYEDRSPSKMSGAWERNSNRIENISPNKIDERPIPESKIEDNDTLIPIINEDSIQSFDYESKMLDQNFGTDIKEAPPCVEEFEDEDDDEDVL
jgi:hypothetical protein